MADRFDEMLSEMREERQRDRELAEREREERQRDREQARREREEWTARIDRRQDQTDENLRFLGELNRRGEIVLAEVVRSSAELRADIRENIELTKAHTRAIFALIDRLEGGSGLRPAG